MRLLQEFIRKVPYRHFLTKNLIVKNLIVSTIKLLLL